MFDPADALRPALLREWKVLLAESDLASDATDQVDEIRALEELACAARARQARLSSELARTQQGRGVAEQVALARRESPHRGRQHLGLAVVATTELPHTMAAFRAGLVTEWRVTVVARETACLSRDDRLAVDRALAGDPEAFAEYADRVVLAELRKLVAALDPAAVAERRRRAEQERCVTVRPAPDVMTYLTALLPVAQGVAVYAALSAEADRRRATGDARSRSQLMADVLVSRVTGCADADHHPVVPVSIGLVMSDRALLCGGTDDASLTGHGTIPADLARELTLHALDSRGRLWLRRLYRAPDTGELVAMDSTQRLFPRQMATFLRHRDQFCRMPWCNAPIRHSDHVVRVADGGTTTLDGGQGLCESCNYTKDAAGWQSLPRPGPGHTVEITTPTGHRYRSTAPPLLGPRHPAFRRVDDGRWVLVA